MKESKSLTRLNLIYQVPLKPAMSRDRDLKREVILHKALIKDLLYQTNTTMRSYLQLAELLEMVIKIILKKGGCLNCMDTSDKDDKDDKKDDKDKHTKLHSIISKVKMKITN